MLRRLLREELGQAMRRGVFVGLGMAIAAGTTAAVYHVAVTTPPPTPGSCAPGTGNAFASPGSCGYPDPAYGTVGVPSGTNLTNSGSFTITQNGTVIDGLNVTGGAGSQGSVITVNADNVTIKNTKVTVTSIGCGPTTCGNSDIKVNGTNVTISHVELTSTPGITVEHAIRNEGGGTIYVDHVYQHGDVDSLCWCGSGVSTFTDNYSTIYLAIAGIGPGTEDHLENLYGDDSTITATHNTFINMEAQTANIFMNTNNGSGGTCSDHLTATNNFLVGSGYSFYPCGNASSQGSSTASITGNRIARCITPEVDAGEGSWACRDGPDVWGLLPRGGGFGVLAYAFGNTVWSGNYWNDNGHYFCEERNDGCPP